MEEGSGEVHTLQGAVAVENCGNGNDAVCVQVCPCQSKGSDCTVDLKHGCHLDGTLPSNGVTIQYYSFHCAVELGTEIVLYMGGGGGGGGERGMHTNLEGIRKHNSTFCSKVVVAQIKENDRAYRVLRVSTLDGRGGEKGKAVLTFKYSAKCSMPSAVMSL